jgi:hypothetical protein
MACRRAFGRRHTAPAGRASRARQGEADANRLMRRQAEFLIPDAPHGRDSWRCSRPEASAPEKVGATERCDRAISRIGDNACPDRTESTGPLPESETRLRRPLEKYHCNHKATVNSACDLIVFSNLLIVWSPAALLCGAIVVARFIALLNFSTGRKFRVLARRFPQFCSVGTIDNRNRVRHEKPDVSRITDDCDAEPSQ